jgi:hypothetical protein
MLAAVPDRWMWGARGCFTQETDEPDYHHAKQNWKKNIQQSIRFHPANLINKHYSKFFALSAHSLHICLPGDPFLLPLHSYKYQHLDNGPAGPSMRSPRSQCPVLDKKLFEWYQQRRDAGFWVIGPLIRQTGWLIWRSKCWRKLFSDSCWCTVCHVDVWHIDAETWDDAVANDRVNELSSNHSPLFAAIQPTLQTGVWPSGL